MKNLYQVEEKVAGQFEITSGSIIISDPCYQRGIWCSAGINNAKKGTWTAKAKTGEVPGWGNRCWELIATHKKFQDISSDSITEEVEAEIGVDSGQCGIFDSQDFPEEKGSYKDPDSWYKRVCKKTDAIEGGVIKGGYVTRSGFGDGGYSCFISKDSNHNQVIAVKIVFIEDEDISTRNQND
jgi:hypothetical protein